ncbi:MAG TPA: WbqC family protein [Trebonia sp.]
MAGMLCAIHQPDFLPRLSTIAKLYAADIWIILDDVQFTRRDYQHRCYLAPAPGTLLAERWLPDQADRKPGLPVASRRRAVNGIGLRCRMVKSKRPGTSSRAGKRRGRPGSRARRDGAPPSGNI